MPSSGEDSRLNSDPSEIKSTPKSVYAEAPTHFRSVNPIIKLSLTRQIHTN